MPFPLTLNSEVLVSKLEERENRHGDLNNGDEISCTIYSEYSSLCQETHVAYMCSIFTMVSITDASSISIQRDNHELISDDLFPS